MHWTRIAAACAVAGTLTVACTKGGEAPIASDEANFSGKGTAGGAAMGVSAAPAPPAQLEERVVASDTFAARRTAPQGVDPSSVPVDAIAPMIIRTGNAVIEVKSIDEGVARLRVIANQLGGYVGNTTVQSGKDQPKSAMVEIKVPSSR